jgi:hypothetical protein
MFVDLRRWAVLRREVAMDHWFAARSWWRRWSITRFVSRFTATLRRFVKRTCSRLKRKLGIAPRIVCETPSAPKAGAIFESAVLKKIANDVQRRRAEQRELKRRADRMRRIDEFQPADVNPINTPTALAYNTEALEQILKCEYGIPVTSEQLRVVGSFRTIARALREMLDFHGADFELADFAKLRLEMPNFVAHAERRLCELEVRRRNVDELEKILPGAARYPVLIKAARAYLAAGWSRSDRTAASLRSGRMLRKVREVRGMVRQSRIDAERTAYELLCLRAVADVYMGFEESTGRLESNLREAVSRRPGAAQLLGLLGDEFYLLRRKMDAAFQRAI